LKGAQSGGLTPYVRGSNPLDSIPFMTWWLVRCYTVSGYEIRRPSPEAKTARHA
jgi:hypothetical protein